MSATGRVALVTGAGQSVGLGIATVLAADGAAVAVNDLHRDRAEDAAQQLIDAGGSAIAVAFDVTDRRAVDTGMAEIAGRLGPVDVLVNNAGIVEGERTSPFLGSDPDDWRPNFELNLFGSMHCIHAAAPAMVERGWGRVIQISSGASSQGLNIGVSLYAAAKAGIEGLIRHLAVEIGHSGVTANALALGLMENVAEKGTPGMFDAMLRSVPVRRFGMATEIGAAVRWLASDEAAFVTGQVIHLNGGSIQGR